MRCDYLKAFIRGRWFPVVVVIIIIAAIAFLMFLLGFRVTYAPKLENSWDAISTFADWVGAIGTILAFFFVIKVVSKQNKIALFEKG